MVPAEAQLWLSWIHENQADVEQMWFDVRMDGVPDQLTPPAPQELAHDLELLRNWYSQGARRCDAIVLRSGRYTILEIRARADAQTIGELALYDSLSRAEWPQLELTRPELITAEINPTTARILDEKQIPIHLIPHASSRWG